MKTLNTKNNQKGFIIPVLLVIIALLVIGGGVYIYQNKKTNVPAIVDINTQQINTQTPPVNTQADTSNWKTHNFNGPTKFSIKYPSSWVPKETNINLYAGSLVLTRGSYAITIGQADGDGGSCIFSDSQQEVNENFDLDLRNVSFVEISTSVGLLRRFPAETIYLSPDIDFSFCARRPDGSFNGGAYSTPIGGINYKLPSNYDPKILLEMDAIVKTVSK